MRALVSLGSNLGDRGLQLRNAVARLAELLVDLRVSPVYATSPVDFLAQDDFFNLAVSGESGAAPEDLLAAFLAIERGLGRERLLPKGPRLIDIDLIYFGDRVLRNPGLTLPHPSRLTRKFVLEPLASIEGSFRDPVSGIPIRELAAAFNDPAQQIRVLGPLDEA